MVVKKKVAVIHLKPEFGNVNADGRCQTEEASWLESFPPVQLASIVGELRPYCEVLLINMHQEKMDFSRALSSCISFNPDYVVFNTSSALFPVNLKFMKELSSKITTKTVLYGEYVSFKYKEILKKYSLVDYIIRGEPETPIRSLILGKSGHKGIASKSHDTDLWKEQNLDKLQIPAYELLGEYKYPLTGDRWMFIRSGRGCPYKCVFCVMPNYNNKLRYHSVDYMIKQIKYCVKHLHIKRFMLWDEVATFDRKRMLEFCEAMMQSGLVKKLSWACTTRVDLFDRELALAMKKAGCFMIAFGIESINQNVLNKNKKGFKSERAWDSVKIAREAGLFVVGHFILGMLGDTRATIRETLSFACQSGVHFAQFYAMTPYIGSDLHKQLLRDQKIEEKYLDQKHFIWRHETLTSKELARLRAFAYLRFYLRPWALYSLLRATSLRRLFLLPFYAFKFLRWSM